jgi:hypothetical protein
MLRMIRRVFLWAVLLGLALVAWSHGKWWQLPDRHNPLAPLQFAEPPGWLTRYKLDKLDDQPAACLATLAQSPLRFQPQADREAAPGCLLENVVRIEKTALAVGEPFLLSCRAAVSLALWEHHALQPAAQAILGSRVVRLQHYGSFACRNVYGRESGRRSQHASADALDVAGFVLEDARRITVAAHWRGQDARADFLRSVHAQACNYFSSVLGPDYNAAHADHFHFDRGSFRVCR